MTPRMRLTLAELLDRYTIELRKDFYGHGNAALIRDVYQEIWGQIANICKGDHEVTRAMGNVILSAAKLGIHNADIANLEWQARAGQQLSLEEHGRRSQAIRHINDKGRTVVKQELSAALGQNVETRHYGYGSDLDPEYLTLDVQEPSPIMKHMVDGAVLMSERPPIQYDRIVVKQFPDRETQKVEPQPRIDDFKRP
jgi:hypothetical protein